MKNVSTRTKTQKLKSIKNIDFIEINKYFLGKIKSMYITYYDLLIYGMQMCLPYKMSVNIYKKIEAREI